MQPRNLLAAALISLGLAGAGWFAAQGMAHLRTADRYVTVKGSADKLVDADLAVWPITFTVNGNDLTGVQAAITGNAGTVRDFLGKAGFQPTEITVSPTRVEDRWAYSYGDNRPPERYRATASVTLRTEKVKQLLPVISRSGELLNAGVLITEGSDPQYDFKALQSIKPGLIAEATANARKAAEQFAKDSGSVVAGIRTANQGTISIEDRDQTSPFIKNVRVVTTVEYFLKD
ncbi:MAG: SIMPL domain-containing protein [Xanthomonadales bacterium]|nr:SIMPL domain-containing protein [Xanthomonadales bacterium]